MQSSFCLFLPALSALDWVLSDSSVFLSDSCNVFVCLQLSPFPRVARSRIWSRELSGFRSSNFHHSASLIFQPCVHFPDRWKKSCYVRKRISSLALNPKVSKGIRPKWRILSDFFFSVSFTSSRRMSRKLTWWYSHIPNIAAKLAKLLTTCLSPHLTHLRLTH